MASRTENYSVTERNAFFNTIIDNSKDAGVNVRGWNLQVYKIHFIVTLVLPVRLAAAFTSF